MKLNLSNNVKKNESVNVQNAHVNNQVIAAAAAGPAVDAEAVEIKDEPKAKAAPKKKGAAKKAAPKKSAPKTKDSYRIQEYTTKKGGTAYLLFGFQTKEAAEAVAEKCSKTVSASWRRNEKGEQLFCLSLGSRYGEVTKALCEALNKGDKKAIDKACAASRDIYELAVAAGKAEREAKKAERAAEKKAKGAESAKGAAKDSKNYSDKDVAKMLSDIMSGKGGIPEAVKKLMQAAA